MSEIVTNSKVVFEKHEISVIDVKTKDIPDYREALNILVNIKSNHELIHDIKTFYGTNVIQVICCSKGLKESNLENMLSHLGEVTIENDFAYIIDKDYLCDAVYAQTKDDDNEYIFIK